MQTMITKRQGKLGHESIGRYFCLVTSIATWEPNKVAEKLAELIRAAMVVVIDSVRQELLSGIPDEKTFTNLKIRLEHFDDLTVRIATC